MIESLLTHQPDDKDTIDSLNRQLKTKLTLIGNRSPGRMKLERFGGAEQMKIWSAMYSYRSKVAHGASINFKDSLKILIDQKEVFELAKSAAKAAVRFHLDEPRLAADLKNC